MSMKCNTQRRKHIREKLNKRKSMELEYLKPIMEIFIWANGKMTCIRVKEYSYVKTERDTRDK